MNSDEYFMFQAIDLAKKGLGLTNPNPPVGAILVKDNKVIGAGWHKKAGLDHAEVDCIKSVDSSISLDDSVLYITLEPCSSFGKTPPCTDFIIKKGIKKVIIATEDCNPLHNGKALKILRDAGVDVKIGICKKEADEIIAPFVKTITNQLPYITLKLAMTIDGKIADYDNNSKWITSKSSRDFVHDLRRQVDGIMVGSRTIELDNPSLIPRPSQNRIPWRIVVGNNFNNTSNVLTDEFKEKTLIRSGNLKNILHGLYHDFNIMHILCEGGGVLATNLLNDNLVDQIYFFIAPKLLGKDGKPMFTQEGRSINSLFKLEYTSFNQIGEDLLIKAKVRR